MTLNEIYTECEKMGIEVYPFRMISNSKGLALPSGCIALDLDKIANSVEEKEILTHEYTHIATGSFYNIYSPIDIKAKHERKVQTMTIKKLVPENELIKAIHNGYIEHWKLAEYFDVSDKFMIEAINYYKSQGVLPE